MSNQPRREPCPDGCLAPSVDGRQRGDTWICPDCGASYRLARNRPLTTPLPDNPEGPR